MKMIFDDIQTLVEMLRRNVFIPKFIRKNSGEVKRSPTSVINLSFIDTINQRSRGSGNDNLMVGYNLTNSPHKDI